MRKLILILTTLLLLVAGCAGSAPAITGDAERGQQIFTQGVDQAPPCSTCHQVTEGQQRFSLGPNLAGVGERARTRVEGLDAQAYIHQSILEPHSYVVSGYRDIMYDDYSEHFTEQDVADLTAYLLTLEP